MHSLSERIYKSAIICFMIILENLAFKLLIYAFDDQIYLLICKPSKIFYKCV